MGKKNKNNRKINSISGNETDETNEVNETDDVNETNEETEIKITNNETIEYENKYLKLEIENFKLKEEILRLNEKNNILINELEEKKLRIEGLTKMELLLKMKESLKNKNIELINEENKLLNDDKKIVNTEISNKKDQDNSLELNNELKEQTLKKPQKKIHAYFRKY